jgi:4-amino-4-deoxy-L-arabinose transferase-like glycosyltransferase
MRLWFNQTTLWTQVLQMRTLNILLAAVTAVVLVLLAERASGSLWAAGATGLLFALDPYIIRQNDRVLLETSMMFFVVLGYFVFVHLIDRPATRGNVLRAVGAGVLFGAAILTKDEAALLILVPLAAAFILRWGPSRRLTAITAGAAVACYGLYVAVVALTPFLSHWPPHALISGNLRSFWDFKTSGLSRLLGQVQISGFHHSGSLVGRLVSEAGTFATTYVLLALAALFVILVLRRGNGVARVLGLLYLAAAIALSYAVTKGTLEEQELYLLVIPSLVITPVAVTLLRINRRAAAIAALMVFTALAGFNVATIVQLGTSQDTGYSQLLAYTAKKVPAACRFSPYYVGFLETPADPASGVRYIVVPWKEVQDGYVTGRTPAEVRALVRRDQRVFSVHSQTYGQIDLYKVLPRRSVRGP